MAKKPVSTFDPSSLPPAGSQRLGLLPAKSDPRTLRMERYLNLEALPPPPSECKWSKSAAYTMLLNDRIGDCVPASMAHSEVTWTANDSPKQYVPTDAEVLSAYSKISGYRPGRPDTDVGCVLLDAMNYWRRVGVGKSRITAFAKLTIRKNTEMLQQAIHLFGAVLIGINMPKFWQGASQKIWLAPSSIHQARGKYAPGGWGGHCVPLTDYDAVSVGAVTWGAVQQISYNALDVYCSEAFVPLGPSWFGSDSKAPNGFLLDKLRDDLSAIR